MSYAKQADDDTLYKTAIRIQSRAIRRCGQLLKEYQTSAKGGRPSGNGDGAGPVSQRQAAEEAGMSERQEKTASRVANVPKEDFEAAVVCPTRSHIIPALSSRARRARLGRIACGV